MKLPVEGRGREVSGMPSLLRLRTLLANYFLSAYIKFDIRGIDR
jgi:hypothetical protein